MRNFKKIYIFIIFVLSIYSCTDIIELDLKNTEPQIIIQANLNATDSTFFVKLTKSNSFYENGDFEKVTEATISLTNNSGATYSIPEISTGSYFLNNIICKPEDIFTTTITDKEGNKYTASTTVPYEVDILQIIPSPFTPPSGEITDEDKDLYQITTFWEDPANIKNFYRVKTYINGVFQADDYSLADDRFEDGDTIAAVSIIEINNSDTIKLKLLSTDEKYFDYFVDIAILYSKGPGNISPYNPVSNFNNNALGYFGIYTVSDAEFIIQ